MIGSAILSACSAPPEPISVGRAKGNIVFWNGDIVSVDGWLGKCEGFDCALFPSRATMEEMRSNLPSSDEALDAYEQALGIGADARFDEKAKAYQYRHVRIRGRLDSTCTFHTCFDRVTDLHPMDIQPLKATSKAD
ncbi:putative porin [Erythrobacter sp. LQ02-29]|uniref:putative porin n=1 Tax=Erythrobacter sp. LQ02-29 TaxID=2920384 RepID=UPI001F4ECEAE|nr:putative porin [Erythrobacter sp. LQ02-29]MCP9221362.1 putative porin [Erythrobacter sp. LQ02-29]